MLIRLRSDIDNLRNATVYYEELVAKCIGDVEDSTASTSNHMEELNKRLKNIDHEINTSRCTHNKENDDFGPLIARYRSVIEHGSALSFNQIASLSDNNEFTAGRLLKRVLLEKPSNESVEDYLDKLASRLVGLARPLTPTWINPQSPGWPMHADSNSAIGQCSTASPITPRTGPGSWPTSATIPGPSSDMPILLGSPFAEHSELGQMAEVPTSPGPFLSLFHEMHRASGQQITPSTMSHPSHSQNTSASISSRAQSPSPCPPVPRLLSDMNFILNIQQALNESLEALTVTSNGRWGFQKNLLYKMMQGIFNFLSFTLRGVRQLVDVGNVYLQTWLDSGSTHARMLLHRILSIHPLLTQVLRVLDILVSPLLSLHTATTFYSCILYIQEVISMTTEVDPEVIIA